MSVLVGRLISGPVLEIVDLKEGSLEQAREFCSDLLSPFGIIRSSFSPSSFSSIPAPLGPDELRELNLKAGQKLKQE